MLPSVLTPFVRSDAVGAILAEFFLHPDSELTIAETARRTGLLPAVTHKEISRLVAGGVFVDRREGNNRLVRVNANHPLYAAMSEIIAATYGPVPVLRDSFAVVPSVQSAFVYGSWAARRLGRPGVFPHDVDVLAIGDLSVNDLLDIQAVARERTGMEVNIHRASVEEWVRRSDNPFLSEVASRPIVLLCGEEGVLEMGAE